MTNLLSVRAVRVMACLAGGLFLNTLVLAQETETASMSPLDDITERTVVANHHILPYQSIRESDILWEKRIWMHNPAQSGQSLPVKVNSKLRVKSGHFSGAN